MRQEKSDLACTCGKVIFKEVISNMLKMFPVDSTGKLSMIVEETRAGKMAASFFYAHAAERNLYPYGQSLEWGLAAKMTENLSELLEK